MELGVRGTRYLLPAVDFFPNHGGISVMTYHLANALADAGAKVSVLAPSGSDFPPFGEAKFELIVDSDSDVRHKAGFRGLQEDRRIEEFLEGLSEEGHDFDQILLMHPFYYGPAAITFASRHKIPVGMFAYGFEIRSQLLDLGNPKRASQWSLAGRTQMVMRRADVVFPISEYTAGVVRQFAAPNELRRLVVTGCGVPVSEYEDGVARSPTYSASERRARRQNLGFGNAPLVAFLGRLVDSKGVGLLVEALGTVEEAQAVIIGDGPKREELEIWALRLGVSDRVTFVGGVPENEKWELLHASDVVVLPSRELPNGAVEGFGIALLEATAAGAMTLGSRSGGITDVIVHGETGRLFQSGDQESLARHLVALLGSTEEEKNRMVAAARERLQELYLWPKVAERVARSFAHLPHLAPESDARAMQTSEVPGRVALIISDAYPPATRGGAEVSLSLLVDDIARDGAEIHVAVLDAESSTPRRIGRVGGAYVYLIPFSDSWLPEPWNSPIRAIRGIARRSSLLTKGLMAASYLGQSSGPSEVRRRLKRLNTYRLLREQGVERYMPTDDDAVIGQRAVRYLRALAADLQPDIIHADNFRSILVASEAFDDGQNWVALVRDNRFYCAHPHGKMHVAGHPCSHCLFECTAPVGDDRLRRHVVEEMQNVIEDRRQRLLAASRIAVTSEFLRDEVSTFASQSGSDPRVEVVLNPSGDPAMIDEIQARIDTASPPTILVVGMIGGNKGQQLVPQLAAMLSKQVEDFRFLLAGRGRAVQGILNEAARLGQSDRVIHLGYLDREALYREYARATLVAAPSIWPEPFGRVPLEAGLSRRPTVAFDLGGLAESILQGDTGILVPPGDLQGFVDALAALLADPELRESMGNRARHWIEERYSTEAVAERLLSFWDGVRE